MTPPCTCRRPRASKYIEIGGVTHDLCLPIARFIDDAAHHHDLLQRIQRDPAVGHLDAGLQDALGIALRKNGTDHVA
jgi:hypothetical protein